MLKQNHSMQISNVQQQDLPKLSHFNPITEEDLTQIITSMKKKENLYDPVPATVVQNNLDVFLPLVLKSINLSLSQGVFPNDLKHAKVSPI